MMGVIDLDQRRLAKAPHREGPARCLNCKHEWHAVAPVGTWQLECPACGTSQGLFDGVSSTEGDQLMCDCGALVFCIDRRGPYCCHCGARPDVDQ
jgi:hypothetical protein